jgi:hypothetical protein
LAIAVNNADLIVSLDYSSAAGLRYKRKWYTRDGRWLDRVREGYLEGRFDHVISLALYLDVLCIIARLYELPVIKGDGLPSTTCVSICYRPRLRSFHEPASPCSVSTSELVDCGLLQIITAK